MVPIDNIMEEIAKTRTIISREQVEQTLNNMQTENRVSFCFSFCILYSLLLLFL